MRIRSLTVPAVATFAVALFVLALSASPAWADPVLSITKDGPARVEPGEEFVYTIQVRNTGTDPANTVVVTDELPSGVTFVRADTVNCRNDGDTDGDGRTEVTCTFATLADDTGRRIELTVRAPNTSGEIENRASVNSAETDRQTSNAVTTRVASDLVINKLDDPDPIREEGILIYTLRVTNEGSRTANNVVIVDDLPLDDVDFIRVRSDDFVCEEDGGLVRCDGALASGRTGTAEIVVEAENAGTIENTADVRSGRVLVDSDTESTEVEARNTNPDPPPDDPDDPDDPGAAATDTLDCDDFSTQAEAQTEFDQDTTDPHNLDPDGDDIACDDFDYTVAAATDTDTDAADAADAAADGDVTEAARAEDVDAASELSCVEILRVFRSGSGSGPLGGFSGQYGQNLVGLFVSHGQYADGGADRVDSDVFIAERIEECLASEVIDKDAVAGKTLADTGGAPILPIAALVLAGVGIFVGRSVLLGGGSSRDE